MKHEIAISAALSLALLAPAPVALAEDGRVWTLTVEEKKPHRAYLSYGVPETDDSFGGFRCKSRSGDVTLFISETGGKLRAGARATAILAVGETQAKVDGKLLPNEEAGVPSFEGRLPANDPIFQAMASGETLVATVGPARQTAPLKGVAEKIGKFTAACAK